MTATRPRSTLLIELWGLGDAVLMTGALQALLAEERRVTVLCAPAWCELLAASYPSVRFVPFHAPWTAFRGKYRLARWPWRELALHLAKLRAERFDEALSVRPDPRDHVLMLLAGARRRCGFPRAGSRPLLSCPVAWPRGLRHRTEDWIVLTRALLGREVAFRLPQLRRDAYAQEALRVSDDGRTPLVVLHPGAAQPVRRWPLEHWRALVAQLRSAQRFQLAVIPDRDGFGGELAPQADHLAPGLSLAELAALIGRAALFLGNDSGPAHLAAALGVPSLAVFGPQHPERFAPRGPSSRSVAGAPCRYRGCGDRCRFDVPHCLTGLPPEPVASAALAILEKIAAEGRFASGAGEPSLDACRRDTDAENRPEPDPSHRPLEVDVECGVHEVRDPARDQQEEEPRPG